MESPTCGVDEAGRGPVIGPLVIGCVVLDSAGAESLRKIGVRDSKKLTPQRRRHLEPLIKAAAAEWRLIYVQPAEIDRLRRVKSLNVIEAEKTAELLLTLDNRPSKIFVDAADAVEENYRRMILDALRSLNPGYIAGEVVAEHGADDRYVEVSAASVLAKVARDHAVDELKAEYGDFGSGYPSDPQTREYIRRLRAGGSYPDFVRRSWATAGDAKQTLIGEY